MTEEELRKTAAAASLASRRAQGLPDQIEDLSTLLAILDIIRDHLPPKYRMTRREREIVAEYQGEIPYSGTKRRRTKR